MVERVARNDGQLPLGGDDGCDGAYKKFALIAHDLRELCGRISGGDRRYLKGRIGEQRFVIKPGANAGLPPRLGVSIPKQVWFLPVVQFSGETMRDDEITGLQAIEFESSRHGNVANWPADKYKPPTASVISSTNGMTPIKT